MERRLKIISYESPTEPEPAEPQTETQKPIKKVVSISAVMINNKLKLAA